MNDRDRPHLFPLLLLLRGRASYLLYVTMMTAVGFLLWQLLEERLSAYIMLLERQGKIPRSALPKVMIVAQIASPGAAVPFALTAIALPVRLHFVEGRATIARLAVHTATALRLAMQSCFWTLERLVRASFPILLLTVGYGFFGMYARSRVLDGALLVLMAIATLSFLTRAVPIALCPLLSIVGGLEARMALRQAPTLSRGRRLESAALMLLIGATTTGVAYVPPALRTVALIVMTIVVWYLLTRLAHLAGQMSIGPDSVLFVRSGPLPVGKGK